MANSRDKTILEDGPRNAIVRVTGVLDSSNESWSSAITLSDWQTNDPGFGRLVGLRLMKAEYAVGDPLGLIIAWHSGSPELIVALAQSGDQEFFRGSGLVPNRTISGYDGSIDISTVGFVPGSPRTYSALLRFAKLYSS